MVDLALSREAFWLPTEHPTFRQEQGLHILIGFSICGPPSYAIKGSGGMSRIQLFIHEKIGRVNQSRKMRFLHLVVSFETPKVHDSSRIVSVGLTLTGYDLKSYTGKSRNDRLYIVQLVLGRFKHIDRILLADDLDLSLNALRSAYLTRNISNLNRFLTAIKNRHAVFTVIISALRFMKFL